MIAESTSFEEDIALIQVWRCLYILRRRNITDIDTRFHYSLHSRCSTTTNGACGRDDRHRGVPKHPPRLISFISFFFHRCFSYTGKIRAEACTTTPSEQISNAGFPVALWTLQDLRCRQTLMRHIDNNIVLPP